MSLISLTGIHEIEFGNNGERSSSVRINVSSQLDGFARGHVGVGRSDGQNDRIRIGNIIVDQVPNLFLSTGRSKRKGKGK